MPLRKLVWSGVAILSAIAALFSVISHAYASGAALSGASLFAALNCVRRTNVAPIDASEFDQWCHALAGRDLFDPDAKPRYHWQGFATTYVVALRVKDHPTLAKKLFVRFRDELSDDQWRRLVTLVRHGPHAVQARDAVIAKTSLE
ncbi:MAG: hypothetical protein EAZ21_14830 [Betaproteobacteria bacterium]|nr:MAG: hypothetical protein EAZ21_14830 [Betaproteobacteria bacterium]